MEKKAGKCDFTSLRAVLESKTREDLWLAIDVLVSGRAVERDALPKSARKQQIVDLLQEAIPACPTLIASCCPFIDQEVGAAIWNAFQWGSARLECARTNHRKLLKQLPFVGIEYQDDDLMIYAPDEIRAQYRDRDTRVIWEEQRYVNNRIDDLVEACVRRYGHVTVNEILDLAVRWRLAEKTLDWKETIKRVVGGRSLMSLGSAQYYLLGDAVLHVSICGNDVRDMAYLSSDFVKARAPYSRWLPKTEDEFLEVLECDFYGKTPAAGRLRDVLKELCGDVEYLKDLLVDLYGVITAGGDLDLCLDMVRVNSVSELKTKDEARVRAVLQDFANQTRLRWLNGHTPAEVGEEYEPLDEDKVIFADEVEEDDLNFPILTSEEVYDPEFDNLDDDEPCVYDSPDGDEGFAPQVPERRTEEKVGRNDPCPCGSGKKYKKCCGR